MSRKLVQITLCSPHRQDLAEVWQRLGFALEADGAGLVLDDGVRLAFVAGDGAALVGLSAESGDESPKSAGEAAGSFQLSSPHAGAAPEHPNGARNLRAVVAIAESPADHAEYLSALTGQREMLATSAGLEIRLDGGVSLEVLTEPAFAFRLGVALESSEAFRVAGLVFAVKKLADTESLFLARGLEPSPHAGCAQVGRLFGGVVGGIAVAFEQA